MSKIIFDTETTGLDPKQNEIVQFSAINENGEVLLNTLIKPEHTPVWEEGAINIHHITPEMVENSPTMSELKSQIETLFDEADEYIAYNGTFDFEFLKAAGLNIKEKPYSDVMLDFAKFYGEPNTKSYGGEFRVKKLTFAADYFNNNFDNIAHDSLEDVRATLFVYNMLNKYPTKELWIKHCARQEAIKNVVNNKVEMLSKQR